MKSQSLIRVAAVVMLGGWLAQPSQAADSLIGMYVGAGVGQANVRIDQRPGNIALGLKENHSAWKLMAGIRPISLVGAEYAHLDFGQSSSTLGTAGTASAVSARAQQRADVLFGVVYLPLPVPCFDLYGKAGTAHVQTDLSGSLPGVSCQTSGCNVFGSSATDTSIAWGAGAQLKLPVTSFALRAEYERFSTSNGNPTLLSVGFLWLL